MNGYSIPQSTDHGNNLAFLLLLLFSLFPLSQHMLHCELLALYTAAYNCNQCFQMSLNLGDSAEKLNNEAKLREGITIYVMLRCEKGQDPKKKWKEYSFCHGNKLMFSFFFSQAERQQHCFQSSAGSILWYVAYIQRFIWYEKFRTCVISPSDPQRHEYQSTFSWFRFITSIQFSFYLSLITHWCNIWVCILYVNLSRA